MSDSNLRADEALEENKVLKVQRAFDDAKEYIGMFHERCNEYYSLYRAQDDPSLFSIVTRARYIVPQIWKTVETITPRIMAVLFSTSPPIQSRFRIQPPTDDSLPLGAEVTLRAIDQLFEWYKDKIRLFWIVEGWVKDSMIYGFSALKVGWRHRKQTVTTKKTVVNPEGDLEEVEEDSEKVIEDTLDVLHIDIRDLFFARDAKFPDPCGTAKYIIHRSFKRKSEVLALRDAGIYETFEDTDISQASEEDTAGAQKAQAIRRETGEGYHDPDPMVEIKEYWEDDWVIATANDRVLLRDEANPFHVPGRPPRKPFVFCLDNLIANELFQVGEAEPLKYNQIERSTLRRQRTDNNSLIINKRYIYNKNAGVDLESMQLSRPGAAIGASPPDGNLANAIIPLQEGDINGASYKEDQVLDQDAQDISGLLDYAVGNAPERRETATTVQLLQTAGNQRFGLKVQHYVQSLLELAEMIYERVYQFQTKPLNVRVPKVGQMGIQYVAITKDMLPDPDWIDFACPGSPEFLLKDARHAKMLQILQMMMQLPTIDPNVVHKFFVRTLKDANIDGIDDILQALEIPTLTMMPGAQTAANLPGGNGAGPGSPQSPNLPVPPTGARPSGTPKMNENPIFPLQPSPNQ